MPLKLEGSCRCGAVHFSVHSHAPYPYQLCYCSICRKTAGGGGFAINLSGENKSLKVRGRKAIGVFRAVQRPTYDDIVRKQVLDARAHTTGTPEEMLDGLLNSGDTWTIL